MANYQIPRSDPANGVITVNDSLIGVTQPSVSVPLVGQNATNYGTAVATTQVHLTETFANGSPPPDPLQGQLWYDNISDALMINSGTDGAGAIWTTVAGAAGGGENNTASNLAPNVAGSVAGLFLNKTGVNLNFKSIAVGAGLLLTSSGDRVTLSATGGGGGGEVNTASNVGGGSGVFAQKVGVDLQFKSLVAGSGVTITPTVNSIQISATGGGGGGDYVDLTTDQTIGGTKGFTDILYASGGIIASDVVCNSVQASAITLEPGNLFVQTGQVYLQSSTFDNNARAMRKDYIDNLDAANVKTTNVNQNIQGDKQFVGDVTFSNQMRASGGVSSAVYSGDNLVPTGVNLISGIFGTIQPDTCDIRLKTNITELPYGLAEVMQMNPFKFNWIDAANRGSADSMGFSAQDLLEIVPEAVPYDKEADRYGSANTNLIPVLVKAMQDQQAIIETLQSELAAIKEHLDL